MQYRRTIESLTEQRYIFVVYRNFCFVEFKWPDSTIIYLFYFHTIFSLQIFLDKTMHYTKKENLFVKMGIFFIFH